MAAVGHYGNYLFSGLVYTAVQYMVSGTFWSEEFIFDVLMIFARGMGAKIIC